MLLPRHDVDCPPPVISTEVDTNNTLLNHFTYANGEGYVITAVGLPAFVLVNNTTETKLINAFSGCFQYRLHLMQG